MLNPDRVIRSWLVGGRGDALDPPPLVKAAYKQRDRLKNFEQQHWMNWKMEDLDRVIEGSRQFELALPDMNRRDAVRTAVADYLDRVAKPYAETDREALLGLRMRSTRNYFLRRVNPETGREILIWDHKACLPLLDPDDAREEAMRIQRRIVPAAMKVLEQPGTRAYYAVFTVPNVPAGKLHDAMRKLSKRFNAMLKKVKRDGSLPIVGAYSVMECPMGWRRDWHPHLNVILITSGWLDYAKVRELWHWNVEMQRLEGSQSRLEAAMREIIKYSVRTVPEKSDAKAQGARRFRDDAPRHVERDTRTLHLHGFEDGTGAFGRGVPEDGCADGERTGLRRLEGRTAAREEGRGEKEAHDDGRPNPQCDERHGHGLPPAPPALIEWTAAEFWEWFRAHKGFRRSRGYGCLYRVRRVREPVPDSGWQTTHMGTRGARGFVIRSVLLGSIPGDKSSTMDARERLKAHLRKLVGPPDGYKSALEVMRQGKQAWNTLRNQTH